MAPAARLLAAGGFALLRRLLTLPSLAVAAVVVIVVIIVIAASERWKRRVGVDQVNVIGNVFQVIEVEGVITAPVSIEISALMRWPTSAARSATESLPSPVEISRASARPRRSRPDRP